MKLYSFPLRDGVRADMENYLNSFCAVMNYCNQIEKLEVPMPKLTPSWYKEGVNRISDAKSHAGIWKTSVGGSLLQMPKTILFYKPVYEKKTQAVHDLLLTLADHPGDESSRQAVLANIEELDRALAGQAEGIQGNIQTIGRYGAIFQDDQAALGEIVRRAKADQQTDQEKIKEVKKEIEKINATISQYDNWITLGEVSAGAGLALVGIGVALPAAAGAASWLILVGGIIAAVGTGEIIALEIAKSISISELAKKNKSLIDLEQTSVSLGLLESNVQTVLGSSSQLQRHVNGIEGLWTGIGQLVGDMRSMLKEEKAVLDRDTLLLAARNMRNANESAAHYYEAAQSLSNLQFTYVDHVKSEAC